MPQIANFWRVGVLDVVLSEYLNKSHNFTNFIFYDVTPRYSISLMDRALRPVIAKARVRFQVKSKFFFRFFFNRLLRLFIRLRGSFPLSWNFKQFATLYSRGNVNRPTNRNARGNNFVHFKNSTRKESADAKN